MSVHAHVNQSDDSSSATSATATSATSATTTATERGRPLLSLRLRARHLIPTVLGHLLLGLLVPFATVLVDTELRLGLSHWPMDTVTVPLIVVLWALALASPVVALVKSRTNGAVLYEHGVAVHSGLLGREAEFIRYDQLAEPPCYERPLANRCTRTASLGLRYHQPAEPHDSPADPTDAEPPSTTYIQLPGLGTPTQVHRIARYIASRTQAP
jgi:hypothetical protein